MSASRLAQLATLRASIFGPPSASSGDRILLEALQGPHLKSYWPNRLNDVARFNATKTSNEIPLQHSADFAMSVLQAYRRLPSDVEQSYHEHVRDWRQKKRNILRRGQARITTTKK